MRLPFTVDKLPVAISPTSSVMDLMEHVEAQVQAMAQDTGRPIEVLIQVIWNLKDSKTPFNPQHTVGEVMVAGDTFGIYGEIMSRPSQQPAISEEAKLPVTILTGFLGSGKTTLLNYILQEQREKKIAIIENEFGEISIDDALLKQNKLALAEKVILMGNGCMCCTVRGDLQQGLEQIYAEVKKGNRIDHIIIETTGMADPVPIVRTFMTDPSLTRDFRLDGVITVADAKHITGRLDDKIEEGKVNEAYQQVAFCDKLLLNKLDLVTAEEAMEVKDRLRCINPYAKILPAVKGRVKVSELTNLRAHDMSKFADEDIEKEAEVVEDGHDHGGQGRHDNGHGGHGDGHSADCTEDRGHGGGGHEEGHGGSLGGGGHGHGDGHAGGHGHVAKKSRHDSRVNSFALVGDRDIIPQKLGKFMQTLVTLPKKRGLIFRIKGILAVKDHPYKRVFHTVMDVSDEDDVGEWGDEKRISKIVFIGKGMDRAYITDKWNLVFTEE
jgi:G3E family GTPase